MAQDREKQNQVPFRPPLIRNISTSAMAETDEDKAKKEAMKSPLQVLKDATSSKASFTLFVLNPRNSTFVALAAVAIVATAFVFMHAGWKEMGNGPGTRTEFCLFALVGLWGGTVATLFQVSIQESIDRFRALNGRLEKEIDMLNKEVDGLEATSEQLAGELAQFDDIRKEMEACAKKEGVQFGDFLNQTTGVFDNMKDVQKQQDLTLLEKSAADIEFLDNKKGMSLSEFKRFCKTVPAQFRDDLQQGIEERFKSLAGDDDCINTAELRAFLRDFVKERGSNPQAGEP